MPATLDYSARHPANGTENELLGWGNVSGLARCRSSARAAGGGENSGSSGNEGKFHEGIEFDLLNSSAIHTPASREVSGRVRPCKAKDEGRK